MQLENLTSIQGPLVKTFPQLDSETIQHADEITNERRTNEELRNQWLWTADGVVYTVEHDTCPTCSSQTKDEPILYLTRGKDNPIFKDIQEATKQLIGTGNYKPTQEDLETAVNFESTLRTRLSDLNLQRYSDEFSYFEIDTVKCDKKLNDAQRAFAERVYGQGNDFQENMKMLKKTGINTTRVYVLTPNYVKEHIQENGAIARACRLVNFGYDSGFDAGDGVVGGSLVYLRGVQKIAEGDARKITPKQTEIDYIKAFDIVLGKPEELNEERALKLLNLTTGFYNK